MNVVGLILSRNQHEHVSAMLDGLDTERTTEVRLQGWEEFDETVDRIVSIGAYEHFTSPRPATTTSSPGPTRSFPTTAG